MGDRELDPRGNTLRAVSLIGQRMERDDAHLARIRELEEALRGLAILHHGTIAPSRNHNPRKIERFEDCPCRSCREATAALTPTKEAPDAAE